MLSSGVYCRSYSQPLQRIITDFGSDVPFGQIPNKLKEHHGLDVPISSAQAITQKHAKQSLKVQLAALGQEIPQGKGKPCLIAQMDGSMIPIVTTTAGKDAEGRPIDRRKTRQIGWHEARLCLVVEAEDARPVFGSTCGTVDQAGAQLVACARRAGVGETTYVHGVGDGALWIASQIIDNFGEPGRYLIDFWHLCEYLGAASRTCYPADPEAWIERQKKRFKRNQVHAVLRDLKLALEPKTVQDNQAPVRALYRYIKNRPGQFDYKNTIAAELPMGSGRIESAHRYIIQKRLKLSGSWWNVQKAEDMLALRVMRENLDWQDYWLHSTPKAA